MSEVNSTCTLSIASEFIAGGRVKGAKILAEIDKCYSSQL